MFKIKLTRHLALKTAGDYRVLLTGGPVAYGKTLWAALCHNNEIFYIGASDPTRALMPPL